MRTVISKEYCFLDDRPFVSCHASTVLPLADGRVMAAWFGGPYESNPDVAIWASFREPGRDGESSANARPRSLGFWSAPTKLADEVDNPHWNPVLSRAPDGTVHLFYKVGKNPRVWTTRVIRSTDEGRTWSEPRDLHDIAGYTPGPVKDKAIVLQDGSWVAPTSKETDDHWDCAVTISADNGETWEISEQVPIDHTDFPGKGVIQPTIWESSPGRLGMLVRTTAGRIYRSDSTDGGRTWSVLSATGLPNNNSGIDCARRGDGLLALVYNDVPDNWGSRSPLSVVFSTDDGATWFEPLVLEHYELTEDEEKQIKLDRAHRANEFSYPAIIADCDRFLVVYTWKRERVAFRELWVDL